MTHTPGPWIARRDGGTWYVEVDRNIDYFNICELFGGGIKSEANARLIAALPTMLRILKEIHYVIEKEEMICPSCGVLCCSDDCELVEIIALDKQVDN